jgi:hypothetical protein
MGSHHRDGRVRLPDFSNLAAVLTQSHQSQISSLQGRLAQRRHQVPEHHHRLDGQPGGILRPVPPAPLWRDQLRHQVRRYSRAQRHAGLARSWLDESRTGHSPLSRGAGRCSGCLILSACWSDLLLCHAGHAAATVPIADRFTMYSQSQDLAGIHVLHLNNPSLARTPA